MADFYIRSGDVVPLLVANLFEDDGNGATTVTIGGEIVGGTTTQGPATNLTLASSVLFIMSTKLGRNRVNHAATITQTNPGIVTYTWQAGDTGDPGAEWQGQFVVTYAGGTVKAYPNAVPIELWIAQPVATT